MNEDKSIWQCKIGPAARDLMPGGWDQPMRQAATDQFRELTGHDPDFIFSGWGGELTEGERALLENREPSDEHYAEWLTRQATPPKIVIGVEYTFATNVDQDTPADEWPLAGRFPTAADRDEAIAALQAEGSNATFTRLAMTQTTEYVIGTSSGVSAGSTA